MRPVLALWLTLRLLLGAQAAFLSALRPITDVEKLPPQSLSIRADPWLWLERWFLAPWHRWDAEWYLRILATGYGAGDGTTQFHPLFTWVTQPFTWLGMAPLLALLLVSSLSGIGFLWVFHRLAALDRTPDQASFATMFLLAFPVSVVLFAPYTEALFLLLASLSLLAARKDRWGWAGLWAGLAILTRQQGIFLAFPLAYLLWKACPLWPPGNLRANVRAWVGMVWLPVGELILLAHRWRLGDLRPVFDSFQDLVYSLLISSSADRVVPEQAFLPPWELGSLVMRQLAAEPDLDLVVNVVGAAVFLVLLVVAWRRVGTAERVYCLVILLVSFSYYTGSQHPLMGLLRHSYLAFPIFLGAADVLTRSWQRMTAIGSGLLGMWILLMGYVWHAWVP
jgi:hypothetical protein